MYVFIICRTKIFKNFPVSEVIFSMNEQPQHIMFVVSAMNLGGAQRVVANLCNYWVDQGFKITLVSTFSGKTEQHYDLDPRVNHLILSNMVSNNSGLFGKILRLRELRRIFVVSRPSVVVSFLSIVNLACSLANIGLKMPLFIAERNYPPFRSLSSRFWSVHRFIFSTVDGIVVQSEKSKQWVGSRFGDLTCAVIPNFIKTPLPESGRILRPELVIKEGKRVILASGRLEAQKNFQALVKIFANVSETFVDWELVILGEGSERVALEAKITDLGLSGRVHLLGAVGNMGEWYRCSEIFVLCSTYEGFPNVLLEAMVHDCAVVSYDCDTGPSDLIRNGENGFLVPLDDGDEGLTEALTLLLTDQTLRLKFAESNQCLRKRYSLENIAGKWIDSLGLNLNIN